MTEKKLFEKDYLSSFVKRHIRTNQNEGNYSEQIQVLATCIIGKLMVIRLWPTYPDQQTKPIEPKDKIIIPAPLVPFLGPLEKARDIFSFDWSKIEEKYIEKFIKTADFFICKKEDRELSDEKGIAKSCLEFNKKFPEETDPETDKLKNQLIDLLHDTKNKETLICTGMENSKTLLKSLDISDTDDFFILQQTVKSIENLQNRRNEYFKKFDSIFRQILKSTTNNTVTTEIFNDFKCEGELMIYIPVKNICLLLYKESDYNINIQILPEIPKPEEFEVMDKYIEKIPKLLYTFDSESELQKIFSVFEKLGFKDASNYPN